MLNKINNTVNFTSKRDFALEIAKKYLARQENVADNRFIQDTATNWLPKAVFTRSLADFSEMSFLEFVESGIFYFLPTGIGNFFKNAYSKFHPEKLRREISSNIGKSAKEILSDKTLKENGTNKRVLSTKAAIILACTIIPAAEYALSFVKNLFTLGLFKKSDFNNIANLNKEQNEDKKQQEKVKINAIKNLTGASIVSLAGFVGSIIFAKYGHKSEILQKASSLILQPGVHLANGFKKIGLKQTGLEHFLKRYITPDFAGINEKTGKFRLSEGQLLVTTVSGLFGYSEAAGDRGKLDQYEVWTRVPIVVLYTVFGSALFDHFFNKYLIKKNIFPEIIKRDANGVTTITETKALDNLAEKAAKVKNTAKEVELNRLIKEKAIVKGTPYLFGIVFMGFLLSGITRFWTQYRYNHLKKNEKQETSPFKALLWTGNKHNVIKKEIFSQKSMRKKSNFDKSGLRAEAEGQNHAFARSPFNGE
ncbi:MAG: hypothetical protein PHC64_03085 [Candidatus Gastranaerophilales bacterium]|nr:hypothetical protein [Candidatus Gastranaerophilales bacterium]